MAAAVVSEPIDLLDGYLYAGDPTPTYAWLREHAPVYWDAKNELWGISRHADIMAVEKNTARYSSAHGSRPNIESSDSMINMDDPGHQQQRRLVAREFTPKAVKQLEADIRAVVTALIDRVCEQGHCEVVYDLAAPLPAIMIGRKLGFPPEAWRDLVYISEVTMQGGGGPRYSSVASGKAIERFWGMAYELIAQRRAEPKDDLISTWVHRDVDGRKLTDYDIAHEAILLLDGGAETTRTVIGLATLELMRQPDQRQILLDDPSVIGETAVEEFIRWVTPIVNMRRTATEDHELHGQQIEAGQQLLLMYPSANRDPEAFDDPDRFDVRRAHNHHVAFGFGTHFCLGASLARIEIRVMFEELLRRIPDMRLEPYADPRIQPAAFARGLKSLRVEFTPSAPEGSDTALLP